MNLNLKVNEDVKVELNENHSVLETFHLPEANDLDSGSLFEDDNLLTQL